MDSYSKSENNAGEGAWGATPIYTKLSQVRNTPLTFAFREDCDNRGNNVGSWVVTWSMTTPLYGHLQSFQWLDPIPMYHGNVSTASFMDGHVEYHKWVDGTLIAYGLRVARGGAITAPGTTSGPDYDYVYNGFRFPTWQP
jgi:prepilin-type processing-associated H-X9-DG protein